MRRRGAFSVLLRLQRRWQATGNANNNETLSKNENQTQNASTEKSALQHAEEASVPAVDIVAEYSKRAMQCEGREGHVKAAIYHEDTSYAPILARGKKNVYEYTDDIPKNVKPFYHWHYTQQREYFRARREAMPLWKRVLTAAGFCVGAAGIAGVVCITRIWLEQPKEVAALRDEILQNAFGRVIELGAGHGQNVGLYPYAVHEICMVDQNAQQLQRLRYRLPKTAYPKYDIRHLQTEKLDGFADGEFDCVVDMFGLCHYRDPVMILRQMQRIVKPTGMILLLEHGRSPYPFVNWILDFFSDKHTVNTHGCRWNLPMKEYFKEARLEVRELRNLHYGTTYFVVAHPENLEELKASLVAT